MSHPDLIAPTAVCAKRRRLKGSTSVFTFGEYVYKHSSVFKSFYLVPLVCHKVCWLSVFREDVLFAFFTDGAATGMTSSQMSINMLMAR
jgi:hypothetical protein